MFKIDDDQIKMLFEAFCGEQEAEGESRLFPFSDEEGAEFYHGLITGLVLCFDGVLRCLPEEKELAERIALAASQAAAKYLSVSAGVADAGCSEFIM